MAGLIGDIIGSSTRLDQGTNSMPFDTLAMAAIGDEVSSVAAGGRIQKIIQPSAHAVALAVYRGEEHWLLLSADATYARLHLSTQRLAKAFPTPSAFVMLLRKYLEGARLVDIEQQPGERVSILTCATREHVVRLVAEVMGKHSNIILLDREARILGAIKIVVPSQSRVRPVLPGREYTPPPAQQRDESLYPPGPRLDPLLEGEEVVSLISAAPQDAALRAALLGVLLGISPFLADQIAVRARHAPTAPLSEVDTRAVLTAAGELYGLRQSRAWRPCTFTNARGRQDFAPYLPLDMADVVEVRSISAAVELCLGDRESRDVLGNSRSALLNDVGRDFRATERRLSSLEDALRATEEAETVMQTGQLLLAYQHAVAPGASELVVPDLGLRIELDPRRTPQENAQRLFRRYRKLRDARQKLPALIAEADAERARLHDLAVFARLATSETELRSLRADLRGEERRPARKKDERRGKARGPARFRKDGYVAIVGRNARENEEVTFRLARRDDLWLHARERTGAHVVLTGGSGNVSNDVVESAAGLAAHFSEGRSDSRVDVDVTQARNVRKIPGGPPGRVTYRSFRTLRVEPGLDGWTRDGTV